MPRAISAPPPPRPRPAPPGAPVPASGLEGSAIALNLGTTVNGLAGDANALATVVVSAIPVGAVLSDGTHTFTASAGSTSVDVHSWNLASLAVTPANDANFTLSAAVTTRDAEGNLSTPPSATEAVPVNPLAPTVAPVAASGLEGSAIALNLGTTVNGLAGDANAPATAVVSAIPAGAVLSDGTHTFTASAGNTSVDVHSWNLASLAVTPANDANFTLSAAVTTRDAEGNLSTTTSATEAGPARRPRPGERTRRLGDRAQSRHHRQRPGRRCQRPRHRRGQRHPGRRGAERRHPPPHGDRRQHPPPSGQPD